MCAQKRNPVSVCLVKALKDLERGKAEHRGRDLDARVLRFWISGQVQNLQQGDKQGLKIIAKPMRVGIEDRLDESQIQPHNYEA